MGYTEPDPREDLSGQDVARKLLILAREIGLEMDIAQVPAQSLVPRVLSRGAFSPRFFAAFAQYDRDMLKRLNDARARGRVLRYVAVLEDGRARVSLEEYARRPLADEGERGIIAFTTKRYSRTPSSSGAGRRRRRHRDGRLFRHSRLLHYLPD
jgi:aspartokinase/homoserine dehydrogenase 1